MLLSTATEYSLQNCYSRQSFTVDKDGIKSSAVLCSRVGDMMNQDVPWLPCLAILVDVLPAQSTTSTMHLLVDCPPVTHPTITALFRVLPKQRNSWIKDKVEMTTKAATKSFIHILTKVRRIFLSFHLSPRQIINFSLHVRLGDCSDPHDMVLRSNAISVIPSKFLRCHSRQSLSLVNSWLSRFQRL